MGDTKAVRKSDWKDGFLFLGNHLALDFLNTHPVQKGDAVELLPDFDALLRWFQAADLLSSRQANSLRQQWGESARAKHVVEAMRELCEKLRKEVISRERGGKVHRDAIDELNHLMAEHHMLTRLKASGSASATELWFHPRQPEDLFAPWRRARPCCSLRRIATAFASVDGACCISMTRARKGPDAGAACNCVETGSRSLSTQLVNARMTQLIQMSL